jgi:hypothetical protein
VCQLFHTHLCYAVQLLLLVAQLANLCQQGVRLDEQTSAQQEREQVGAIGIVGVGWHHVLDQGVQGAGYEVAIAIDKRLKREKKELITFSKF